MKSLNLFTFFADRRFERKAGNLVYLPSKTPIEVRGSRYFKWSGQRYVCTCHCRLRDKQEEFSGL